MEWFERALPGFKYFWTSVIVVIVVVMYILVSDCCNFIIKEQVGGIMPTLLSMILYEYRVCQVLTGAIIRK